MQDPVKAIDSLGAVWAPNFDSYAAGEIPVIEIVCVLCRHAPCNCPPFGTPEYLTLVRRLHNI
jgi:hypothetical protein